MHVSPNKIKRGHWCWPAASFDVSADRELTSRIYSSFFYIFRLETTKALLHALEKYAQEVGFSNINFVPHKILHEYL